MTKIKNDMTNTSELIEKENINRINRISLDIKREKEKIEKMESLAKRVSLVSNTFSKSTDILNEIANLGLELKSVNLSTFGKDSFDKDSIDSECKISANLYKTENSKFKFLKWKGYTKSGRDMRRPQLHAKQTKLEEALSNEDFSASINLHSLGEEDRYSQNTSVDRVMIEWRPKFK